jgi:hypothetical protein
MGQNACMAVTMASTSWEGDSLRCGDDATADRRTCAPHPCSPHRYDRPGGKPALSDEQAHPQNRVVRTISSFGSYSMTLHGMSQHQRQTKYPHSGRSGRTHWLTRQCPVEDYAGARGACVRRLCPLTADPRWALYSSWRVIQGSPSTSGPPGTVPAPTRVKVCRRAPLPEQRAFVGSP